MLPLTLPSPHITDTAATPIASDDATNSDDHTFKAIASAEPRNSNPCHRKRPKYTRSKAGCLTCRTKKIKCDESHPRCTRCINAQRDCTWPQNPAVTKKSQAAEKRKRELRANAHVDSPITLLPTPRTASIGSVPHPPVGGSQDSTRYYEESDASNYAGMRSRQAHAYASPPGSDSSEEERERSRAARYPPLDPVTNLSGQTGSRDHSPPGFSFAAAPDLFGPHPPHALAAQAPHAAHPSYASHYDPRRSPTPTATNPYINYNRGAPQQPPAFYPFIPGFNPSQQSSLLSAQPKLTPLRQPQPQPTLLPLLTESPPHIPLTLASATESESTSYSSLLFPPGSPTNASSSVSPTSATFSITSSAPSLTHLSNSGSPSSESTHIDLESVDLDVASGVTAPGASASLQNLDESAEMGLGLGLGYGTGGVQGLCHWNGPGPGPTLAIPTGTANEYHSNQNVSASGVVFGPTPPPSAYPSYPGFSESHATEPAQTYTAHAAAAAIAPQMFSTPDPLEPFFHTVQERSLVGPYLSSPHTFSTPPPLENPPSFSVPSIRRAESDVRLRSHAIYPLPPLANAAHISKTSLQRHSSSAIAKR